MTRTRSLREKSIVNGGKEKGALGSSPEQCGRIARTGQERREQIIIHTPR